MDRLRGISDLGSKLKGLNSNELRILNYVCEHKSIKVTQAQRLITDLRRWQTLKKLLDNMVQKGLLAYHSHGHRDSRAYYTLPIQEPSIKTEAPS